MPIYLDHNASTPAAPSVIDVVARTISEHFANASSTDHSLGAAASKVVESARSFIAQQIGARPADIIFTSGATEANCLAIRGAYHAQRPNRRHSIITTATEHPSVLRTIESLVEDGANPVILPVDSDGLVNLEDLTDSITNETALVTVMAANNETGVLQPIADIGQICTKHGVLFHSDLSQFVGYAQVDVAALGIHLGSMSAHKMYGPKGVGALYARARRPRARLVAQQTGGGQERGLRSGTFNTEGIAGFAEAFRVRLNRAGKIEQLRARRDRLEARLLAIHGAHRNGHALARLPHTMNISIDGIDPHALQYILRDKVVFSTSSACSTAKVETSHVLLSMHGNTQQARDAFRLGLGFGTTDDEIDFAAESIIQAVSHLRSGSLTRRPTTNLIQQT